MCKLRPSLQSVPIRIDSFNQIVHYRYIANNREKTKTYNFIRYTFIKFRHNIVGNNENGRRWEKISLGKIK